LKPESEVTVTVSVAELPEPTVKLEALSENEKSAPDVIVNEKVVVCVVGPLVPLIVMVLVPAGALGSALMVRVAEAEPAAGTEMGFGLKLEKLTPEGTEPVMDRVTAPEKLKIDVPVTVMLAELPCETETVLALGARLKSGAVIVSFASLFALDSSIQALPDASTITSCGSLLAPRSHSVKAPVVVPVFALLEGDTVVGVTGIGPSTAGAFAPEEPA